MKDLRPELTPVAPTLVSFTDQTGSTITAAALAAVFVADEHREEWEAKTKEVEAVVKAARRERLKLALGRK